MTDQSTLTEIAAIASLALTRAAAAVAADDAAMAERWLKVARSAGLDPSDSMETKGETILERRASRDRLMAVLVRRFQRINLKLDEDADGVPQLPALVSASQDGP